MDWLRDQLAPRFEARAGAMLKDPWAARDQYIDVILDRSPENIRRFFSTQAKRDLDGGDYVSALRMLEIQRHALLMYTSCGWFFDELSGLEAVQVIQYAARAVQLAQDLWHEDLESGFLERLAQAKSNIPEHADGRVIYEKFVRPAIVTRETVGAHYAISSIFESYPADARLYAFSIHQEDRQMFRSGEARLALGRARVTFEITQSSDLLTYGVLCLGSHNVNCWVHLNGQSGGYGQWAEASREAFNRGDFAQIIRLMDAHFGQVPYSLKNLFRDEQRKLLGQILASTRDEIHSAYRLIAERFAPLLRFTADLHVPPVEGLEMAVEIVLNGEIRCQFEGDHLDVERVRSLLAECRAMKVAFATELLAYACKGYFDRLAERLRKTPEDVDVLRQLGDAAKVIPELPFEGNLWRVQNVYFDVSRSVRPGMSERSRQGDGEATRWNSLFSELGDSLGFSIPAEPQTSQDALPRAGKPADGVLKDAR
jgi:hypothetical protein